MKRFFIIMIFSLLFSCDKDNDNDFVNQKATFHGLIGDKSVTLIESDNIQNDTIWSPESEADSGLIKDTLIYKLDMLLGGHQLLSYKNQIQIQFIDNYNFKDLQKTQYGYELNENQFRNTLKFGKRVYSNSTCQQGIIINWYDSKGTFWSTIKKIDYLDNTNILEGAHIDNVFSVTQSKISNRKPYTWSQYLEMDFNCRLYNFNGDSIDITSGNFKCNYGLLILNK